MLVCDMRVAPLLLAASAPVALAALASACAAPPAAAVGLVLKTEAALLDQATSLKLSVFDGTAARCEDDGSAGEVPASAQEFQLGQEDCGGDAAWCTEIELDRDGSTKVFYIEAQGPGGLLAQGCAAADIDQDPVTVNIKVQRYVPPSCCNDGILQAREQCDSGQASAVACDGTPAGACTGMVSDVVCACDCTTNVIPLDRVASDPVPAPGEKTELAMTFARGGGDLQNALRTAFTDVGAQANGGADVMVRYLDGNAAPFDEIAQADVARPFRVPLACSNPTGGGAGRGQRTPALAALSPTATALVYLSNESDPGSNDAFLLHLGGEGCAEDPAERINTIEGGVTSVDVAAGPAGSALVVWSQGGAVRGRFWSESTGFADEIEIAAQGSAPRVAGSTIGWAVAYQGAAGSDGDAIVARTIVLGPSVGPEIAVNLQTQGLQDQPDVAMLSNGQFGVVWRSAGDVFLQRFSAGGFASEGDQDAPLNTVTEGEQALPTIEGSGATGSFYVAAWSDPGSGEVRARFLGDVSGFLFNSVTGQNGEFTASPIGVGGARSRPALAVGGNGHVAIGWQDDAQGAAPATGPGVYVRRFPLPTAQ
jgi:hypothetical protein